MRDTRDDVQWEHNDDWSLWEAYFANPHERLDVKQIAAIERTEDNKMIVSATGVQQLEPFTEWIVLHGPMFQKIERFPALAQAKSWVEARRYPLWESKSL